MKSNTKLKKIIVANWKMNPATYTEAERLVRGIVRGIPKRRGFDVVLCPPFIYLRQVKSDMRQGIKLGAQDVFWENKGAFTGEISPAMLKNSGVKYVIIGHSERRRWLRETDEMINKKVKAALRSGLKIILCVGEPLSVRRSGIAAAKRFVANQIKKDLKGPEKTRTPKSYILNSNLIIAYEPIWAIGTGRADKPEDTAEMAQFIKNFLKTKTHNLKPKVLYGGSVNSKNAKSFLCYNEIDGALVGGASLIANDFKKICKIASGI